MRVAFLLDTSLGSRGISNYSRLLAAELEKVGFEIQHWGIQSFEHHEYAHNERFYASRTEQRYIPTLFLPTLHFFRILRLDKVFKPNLVIASRQGGAMWCFLSGKKFVYFVHQSEADTWRYRSNKTLFKKIFYSLLKKIDSFLYNRAQLVLIPSSSIFKEVVSRGVRKDKIRISMPIIYETETETETLQPPNVQSLSWVGRITALKNPIGAVEFVEYLSGIGLDISLSFFGQGDQAPLLEDCIRQKKNISYEGFLTPEYLDQKLRQTGTLLITSRSESFGLVAIEALRRGSKILSTPVGIMPELALLTKNVLIVDLTNRDNEREIFEFLSQPFHHVSLAGIEAWSRYYFNSFESSIRKLCITNEVKTKMLPKRDGT